MVDVIQVSRAAVFHNTGRLTLAQIKAQTGCSHIINGYLFNNKPKSKDYFKPNGWLVIDGEVISKDQYHDWGFGCGPTGAPAMTTDRTKSFLSGIPILKDGQKLARNLTPDVARSAERTAVGWLEDGRVLLWCDKTKLTREQLQLRLLERGCKDAIMLDGGGSTQGIFPDGKVYSSRKVATLLLFWEQKEDCEPKGDKPMVEINAYSLKKDGETFLTEHFRVKEFACKDGSDPVFIAKMLPMICEYIRMRCKKGISINSGYRTVEHNAKPEVGGAEYSQHLYGTAADLRCPAGFTPKQMAGFAREIMPDWGGVGIYDWGIHVDVRDEKADWNG